VNNIFIRSSDAQQWAPFLAEPVKHWRTGFSARTLAYSWQEAQGFPTEVKNVLSSAVAFHNIELLLGIPEHQVPLPGGTRPSQNDIWVLARADANLVSIAVEGKVGETFGPTVEDWLSEPTPGKSDRLAFLRIQLGLNVEIPGTIRYQLLHRTASAVIEASRFCAPHAIMLVHSFSQTHERFGDYAAFAKLFGVEVEINRLVSVGSVNGIGLHLCWVCGNELYLAK
jgi:hypothetical protein